MFEELYGHLSNERIKENVLIDFYITGRINGYYFDKKSKSKVNPIHLYIKRYLNYNGLADESNELLFDCYQTLHLELWKIKPEKIVEMLKRKPNGNEIIALSCKILVNTCFSKKENSKTSGLVHNILEKSVFNRNNFSIDAVENHNGDDIKDSVDVELKKEELIIFDEFEDEEFTLNYGVDIEEFIEKLSPEDKDFFYEQLKRQRVGKPTKELQAKRQSFHKRVRDLRESLKREDNIIDQKFKDHRYD